MTPSGLNAQVQKAFSRLENLSQCDLPSHELTSKLLSELNSALLELQTTAVEILEQNEEMAASRQTLEEERYRYQELFDSAPDGYLVTDMEGIILDANSAAANLFNVSKSLLIGKPLAIFVRSEEHMTFRTRLAEMRKGTIVQKESWELIMLSGKQTAFPVSITVGKVISSRGGISELRWLLRDITKRKQMDEEKEKRAAELVIVNKELTHQKKLVYQNEEKEKRAAELVIANKELAFQNEEKEKRAAELVIANKELAYQNEEKEKRAAELIIANKELAYQNEEKEKRAAELVILNVMLGEEISERKKAEIEIKKMNDELEVTISARTYQLEEMNAEFEEMTLNSKKPMQRWRKKFQNIKERS